MCIEFLNSKDAELALSRPRRCVSFSCILADQSLRPLGNSVGSAVQVQNSAHLRFAFKANALGSCNSISNANDVPELAHPLLQSPQIKESDPKHI